MGRWNPVWNADFVIVLVEVITIPILIFREGKIKGDRDIALTALSGCILAHITEKGHDGFCKMLKFKARKRIFNTKCAGEALFLPFRIQPQSNLWVEQTRGWRIDFQRNGQITRNVDFLRCLIRLVVIWAAGPVQMRHGPCQIVRVFDFSLNRVGCNLVIGRFEFFCSNRRHHRQRCKNIY